MGTRFAVTMAEVFQRFSTAIRTLCFIALTIALAVPIIQVWPLAKRINLAGAQLLDCTVSVDGKTKGNPACLQSQILAITGSTKATMGAVAKAAPEIAGSLAAASSKSVEASAATVHTVQDADKVLISAQGAIDQLHATLTTLDGSIKSLTQDSSILISSANHTIEKAGLVMVNLAALETTLDKQIQEQSPEVGNTLKAMQALLNNPAFLDTIKHIDGTTIAIQDGAEHSAEIVKTFDLATRGLREKVGKVKWLIEHLLNMIKVTVPLF